MIKNVIQALASLKLSIVLLVLALLLVYFGTWAQVDAVPKLISRTSWAMCG